VSKANPKMGGVKPLKILNLYAGIGGNRKLWGDNHDITAVEFDKNIAAVYSEFYPNDTVVVGDAHAYLLSHANEFDVIWASPPCPTHSDIRRCGVHSGQYEAVYPDMTLYQEIIFLQNFFKGKFIIENVKPYYDYLIAPTITLGRHPFWTNFNVPIYEEKDKRVHNNISGKSTIYGINLNAFDNSIGDKRKMLRNMVNPKIGLFLLDMAINAIDKEHKKTIVPYIPSLFDSLV